MSSTDIIFSNTSETFGTFFERNKLDDREYDGCTFTLTGESKENNLTIKINLVISHSNDNSDSISYKFPYPHNRENKRYTFKLFKSQSQNKYDLVNTKFEINNSKNRGVMSDEEEGGILNVEENNTIYPIITELEINNKNGYTVLHAKKATSGGKKSVKKELLGKIRCIYKIHGSRKEYVKHKGSLITVTDYKKLMRNK